jgi:hypothetical protein
MLMLKRLVVWLIETLLQVPLLMALLMLLSDLSSSVSWFDVRLNLFGVIVFMLGSAYPITTGIAAILFRGRIQRLYPPPRLFRPSEIRELEHEAGASQLSLLH